MATRIAEPGEPIIEFFADWLDRISNPTNRAIAERILAWVHEEFPDLGYRFAWKQPMFTHHGTFIIGFSPATNHISFAPERAGIVKWEPAVETTGVVLRENDGAVAVGSADSFRSAARCDRL
ncbi:iron chaperone [Corynebacterium diphtheriae bv. mitis]|nr:iron chaperone [Corynebacterium diphtheriae bv. mitis]